MRLIGFVRFAVAALLLATASLVILPAPTHLLWMVTVGVTEWGHALALICLGASVILWSSDWSGKAASAICVTAAVLALIPVIRAAKIARNLPARLNEAFGEEKNARSAPLVYTDLFRGISPPDVKAETIVYETIGGAELSLDFYRTRTAKPAPLVVAVHGGSWQSGDNKDFVPMDQYLAGRGFAVADVLYRFAPKWPFPAASDDIRTAIAFMRKRSASFNIDPNRIVLLGRSAGGQIVLNVAYASKDPGVRGVIAFYAPTDLSWGWDHPGNPRVIDTRVVLKDYLGGSPSDVPSTYAAASPVDLVTANTPPTLLLHGGRDELVSPYHSNHLDEILTQAHVPHLNISLPWATHGFDYILRGPGGQISLYAIESFLARVTR